MHYTTERLDQLVTSGKVTGLVTSPAQNPAWSPIQQQDGIPAQLVTPQHTLLVPMNNMPAAMSRSHSATPRPD